MISRHISNELDLDMEASTLANSLDGSVSCSEFRPQDKSLGKLKGREWDLMSRREGEVSIWDYL
jgi:hypothetical protein